MSEASEKTANPDELANIATKHTYYFFVGYYALAVVWGLRGIYRRQPSALDYLVPFGLAICLGWWAVVDARRRRKPIKMSAQPWFFLLAGVVVPAYVIWSRGWYGVGWLVLHALLWMIMATIAMHVGGIIVYGEDWVRMIGAKLQ